MKKNWLIMSVIFIIALAVLIINIPKILGRVFENSTRILENRAIREAPPEYLLRIRRDFDCFIIAFKEKKLNQEDLTKFSNLIKSANEDGKLDQIEIDNLLELIETITPGLK